MQLHFTLLQECNEPPSSSDVGLGLNFSGIFTNEKIVQRLKW